MPVAVPDIIQAVDELRVKLVDYDAVEAEVIKSKDVVAQAEALSGAARDGVLAAIQKLQEILLDIQRRYSKSTTPVPDVETSHEIGT